MTEPERADKALNSFRAAFREELRRQTGERWEDERIKTEDCGTKSEAETEPEKEHNDETQAETGFREDARCCRQGDGARFEEAGAGAFRKRAKGTTVEHQVHVRVSEAGAGDQEHDGAQRIRELALELANAPQWTGPMPSERDDIGDADSD